jgi:hypothetical protein
VTAWPRYREPSQNTGGLARWRMSSRSCALGGGVGSRMDEPQPAKVTAARAAKTPAPRLR